MLQKSLRASFMGSQKIAPAIVVVEQYERYHSAVPQWHLATRDAVRPLSAVFASAAKMSQVCRLLGVAAALP